MLKWQHFGCKLLAALAWSGASAWLLVSFELTWGFVPFAMALWSVAAVPIAGLTVLWLKRLGQPVSARGESWTKAVWAALLVVQLPVLVTGDHSFWVAWGLIAVSPAYIVFPVAVTAWALVRIVRARSGGAGGLTTACT